MKRVAESAGLLCAMFVDYGYEVRLDEEPDELTKIVPLADHFLDMPRCIFSAALATRSPTGFERMSFGEDLDEADLAVVLETFFESPTPTFELKILCRLDAKLQLAGSYHYEDELYFGIQMYNKRAKCLNDILAAEKERRAIAAQIERERLQVVATFWDSS